MRYVIEEIMEFGDRKSIDKVNTMVQVHQILTKLTDGHYKMLEYKPGDKYLQYISAEGIIYEVHMIYEETTNA